MAFLRSNFGQQVTGLDGDKIFQEKVKKRMSAELAEKNQSTNESYALAGDAVAVSIDQKNIREQDEKLFSKSGGIPGAVVDAMSAACFQNGDIDRKAFPVTQHQQHRIFGKKIPSLPSLQASLAVDQILWGYADEAVALVKGNPSLLNCIVEAKDPLGRKVKGKLLQVAAMAGDVDLKKGIQDEKYRGIVERLKAAARLSDEEVRFQLEEVLTSKEAVAENEKRNQCVLDAIITFGEGIILKASEYKGDNIKGFQKSCKSLVYNLEAALTPDPNKVIKSGAIFDPMILRKAVEWFEENANRFGEMRSMESKVFWVNGFGKLQSKLSSRDAQVFTAGIRALVDDEKVPNRSLLNSDNASYFYNSSSRLGWQFYLGPNGAPRSDISNFGQFLAKLTWSKNSSVAKLIQHPDSSRKCKCLVM